MNDHWRRLIEPTIAVKPCYLEKVVENWLGEPDTRNRDVLLSAFGGLTPGAGDVDWPTGISVEERLKLGVYTLAQVAIWQFATETKDELEREFPFLFSTVGRFSQRLVASFEGDVQGPASLNGDADSYRSLLQSLFHIRELREEGEPLSLEVRLPFGATTGTPLEAKRLAQIFGRGVGVATGQELTKSPGAEGRVHELFQDHSGSPMSALYHLKPEFGHIPNTELRLVLRRDGLISLAANQNPLLEFYDGGWHIVDLNSGRVALDYFIDKQFREENGQTPEGFTGSLLWLAYHMATHWHGGVLAVLNRNEAEGSLLEQETPTSKKVTDMLKEQRMDGDGPVSMTDVRENGLGRALLTCAIQDGATVFLPDGTLHSAGRIVSQLDSAEGVGTGHRAAKSLGKKGVAIKISKDGAIKVFCSPGGVPATPERGLRIR